MSAPPDRIIVGHAPLSWRERARQSVRRPVPPVSSNSTQSTSSLMVRDQVTALQGQLDGLVSKLRIFFMILAAFAAFGAGVLVTHLYHYSQRKGKE